MRPLSESSARVADKNFSKKYIVLGRVISQWQAIMGDEFASIAQPVKIQYRKIGKEKKTSAILFIATSDANATILTYRKGVILERINALFGQSWITDIKFTPSTIDEKRSKPKTRSKPLTPQEQKYLCETLDGITDPEFKVKLENLGKAFLNDQNKMDKR